MHPFHLSQAIYFGVIIIFILGLFVYEKISKKVIPKTKIIIYSLTIVLVISILISVYFYLKYDYSLIFPADYYQAHNYLFVIMALFIFGAVYKQKGLDYSKLNQKDKVLLCSSLILIILIIIVPTSEKIADRYQYHKANNVLTEEDSMEAAIVHDVSSCRENPEYRRTYQIFDCELEGSRVYYMFAKNTTSEIQQAVIHITLFDQNNEQIESLTSKEMTIHPNEIKKVLFDGDVFDQPEWMQHSFSALKRVSTYEYEIEQQGE